jgi:hypothetical protein
MATFNATFILAQGLREIIAAKAAQPIGSQAHPLT